MFSIVFDEAWSGEQVTLFVDALELFKIGYSWGGVTSTVMTYPALERRGRDHGHRLVRLNVGLEEARDLIADLDQAFACSAGVS